jgi:lipoyl synthase
MRIPKPEWLKIKITHSKDKLEVENILKRLSLHTVCEEALCPNRMECFSRKTATFMVLGTFCTRNCTFCNVEKADGKTTGPDKNEPENVANAVKELGLAHTVITSVTRDDLPDGGAGHFAEVIGRIKQKGVKTVIEVLIPDFQGNLEALNKVILAGPHIINHNVETVPRLYPEVRPMADYRRSLELIRRVKSIESSIYTKSGIMLGLGENGQEVLQAMRDLRENGCEMITIGQYLAPSKLHHPVIEYVHPDVFEKYKKAGMEMGFKSVSSGPFVRSSYHAGEVFNGI